MSTDKRKALGRGMASLIPDASMPTEEVSKSYFFCDIENVIPNKDQPRKKFNEEPLRELSDSIREKGILQPLLVRKISDFQYEIIAGERRWRAAQRAGLKKVPVVVREASISGKLEEALIENLQREDLNSVEEAKAFQRLIDDFGYTQEELARKIGKQRPTIANSLRLLDLPQVVQELILDVKLTAGHARALLSLEDPEKIEALAREVVSRGLSVRDVERLAKGEKVEVKTTKTISPKDPYLLTLEQELSQHFKAKIKIYHGAKKGKLEIEYLGEEELNRIVAILKA